MYKLSSLLSKNRPNHQPAQKAVQHSFEQSISKQAAAHSMAGAVKTYEVPAHITSWWLFKDESEASRIPTKNVNNVIHNAALNPSHKYVFKTNDPARLVNSLPSEIPANLSIESEHFQFSEQFPLTALVAKGAAEEFPQLSKDLLTYEDARKTPGFKIDPDTRLEDALPLPLQIKSHAAIHSGSENSVIAYSGAGVDSMTPLLQQIEKNIPRVFNIETDETSGQMHFHVKKGFHGDKNRVVSALEFDDFFEVMQDYKRDRLEDYIKYNTPRSSSVHDEKPLETITASY